MCDRTCEEAHGKKGGFYLFIFLSINIDLLILLKILVRELLMCDFFLHP